MAGLGVRPVPQPCPGMLRPEDYSGIQGSLGCAGDQDPAPRAVPGTEQGRGGLGRKQQTVSGGHSPPTSPREALGGWRHTHL